MKRFSLAKRERISGESDISSVIRLGNKAVSDDKKIRVVFRSSPATHNGASARMAVAVSRRSGNAVWRNRMKRLIRAAYRLGKHALLENCTSLEKSTDIIFFTGAFTQKACPAPRLQDVQASVNNAMTKVIAKL